MENCKLCSENKELVESHIIPKFIGKWLKKTSSTGYLTSSGNDEVPKRSQDLTKRPLLCKSCENVFSKFETFFANKIFFPYSNKQLNRIPLDDKIGKFIISVSLRASFVLLDSGDETTMKWSSQLIPLINDWKKYLLCKKKPSESDNGHYLLFATDHLLVQGLKQHDDIVLNVDRSCSFYTFEFFDSAYIFVNMAGFQIISMIEPKKLPVERGCEVYPKQTFGQIHPSGIGWGGYFQNIITLNKDLNQLKGKATGNYRELIKKSIERDKQRHLKSEDVKKVLFQQSFRQNTKEEN